MMRRVGGRTIWLREGVEPEAVLEALEAPGDVLKESSKSLTRRVGDWVVKVSRFEGGLGVLKHTLFRNRYRQAWRAANHLKDRGVRVPSPIAYVERGWLGVIVGNAYVSEYLDGYVNVERFAAGMAGEMPPLGPPRIRGGGAPDAQAFFSGLARAVNALNASGAYHADLSGKNIFTRNGTSFCFLDLDGVVLGKPYTEARRMKNHVQLYDSFCDVYDETVLGPFVSQMLPADIDASEWLVRVKAGQRVRRATHCAKQ